MRKAAMNLAIPLVFIGICGAAALLLFGPRAASGTEALMGQLPSFSRFRCLICHTTAVPTEESKDLNTFGVDFMANGGVWDITLALKNSDNDACPNGFELGDRDGDGKLDAGIAREHSNPGNPADCRVALTEGSWGKLKKLFEE